VIEIIYNGVLFSNLLAGSLHITSIKDKIENLILVICVCVSLELDNFYK